MAITVTRATIYIIVSLCCCFPLCAFALDAQQPAPSLSACANNTADTEAPNNCTQPALVCIPPAIDGVPAVVITAWRPGALVRLPSAASENCRDRRVTSLTVHVLPDGTVKSATVASSSGNADLDNRARAYLTGAHVAPITSGGAAIEADSTVNVAWPNGTIMIPSQLPLSTQDDAEWYPPNAFAMHRQGYAILSFTILADGTAKNVTVLKSTGFADLDNASVGVVSQSRFPSVTMQNGKPVDIDGKTAVVWRLL